MTQPQIIAIRTVTTCEWSDGTETIHTHRSEHPPLPPAMWDAVQEIVGELNAAKAAGDDAWWCAAWNRGLALGKYGEAALRGAREDT